MRDVDRHVRVRDIRTAELVDNICNFLDEERGASLLAMATQFEVVEATCT